MYDASNSSFIFIYLLLLFIYLPLARHLLNLNNGMPSLSACTAKGSGLLLTSGIVNTPTIFFLCSLSSL